ncbi:MAG: FG-GAP repeat domain-containing protein [Planctomycetota bacterium]
MRLIKTAIAIIFVSSLFSNVSASQADFNDISAYYGFAEIEIIKLDWGIKDLRVADFNGDGRNDIAVVNNRKAKIELLVQKEAIGPGETEVAVDPGDRDVNIITPPTRFEKHGIAVPQKVYSLVCGDLDSDGMTDLAFYGEPRGLYVILQKTGETETDKPKSLNWRTKKKIKIDDGLLTSNMLVCADLNNDGADDLALAGRDVVYIVVQEQAGSLAEPVKYPTSAQTLRVEVGDLNGDNINDLILVTNDREKPAHVRFGLKTGQLGPQVQFFIERPFTYKLHNIDEIAGDEILAVDGVSGRLTCYKLAAEKQKDTDWPILFYPLASGQADTKRDLAVGDFDGDGLADVTISDPGAAELIFYKHTAGLGLAEPVRFPALADITSLSAADIDDNGKTELGVLSVKEKVLGISRFEDDRLSFPKPIDLTGEPVAMELADVDNDGSVDCLYISNDDDIRTLRTIYNLAAAEKLRTGLARSKGRKSKIAEKVGETEPALELKGLTSNPDGLKVLDVDQDGLQDVLMFVSYELPILVRQVQEKKFEVVDSPKAQASLIKDASLRSIAIANVDGKAGEELFVAQKNFARSLVFSDGQQWSVIDQYNAKSPENQVSAVAAFDINAERSRKRLAILLLDGQKGQLQILDTSLTDKTYRVEKELDVGKWNAAAHLKMLFAPLTHGEAKSILLFDSEKFALISPLSSGSAAQHLEQQFSYETKIKDGIYGNLTAGDINSDGRTDIIMVEHKRNHMEILALDASVQPIPVMRFKIFEQKSYRDSRSRIKPTVEPRELKVADVTSDDKDDLVTVIHDRIIIYPQD